MYKSIKRAFETAKSRGWNKIYIAVDLHGTVIESTYNSILPDTFYKNAKECLQYLSSREDIVLIMWSSCYSEQLKKYQEIFSNQHDIDFKYLNENPECENTETGCFYQKFYFSIVIDDKGGFNPDQWLDLHDSFKSFENFLK